MDGTFGAPYLLTYNGDRLELKFNDQALRDLENRLRATGKVFNEKRLVGGILRRSMEPLQQGLQQNAPVWRDPKGGGGGERVSLRQRSNPNSGAYRRGGATRADQRIKIVEGRNGEVVRGLAGTSKGAGRVGWRTRFITLGTKFVRANDFITRAFNQRFGDVVALFQAESDKTIKRILK